MTTEIEAFIHYLEDVKQSSRNTVVSYQRDLRQLKEYLERQGIEEPSRVTKTSLNAYISYLQRKGKATTTISRILASTKAFFHYEFMEGNIHRDPAELLKTPKIEKKIPLILSVEEVNVHHVKEGEQVEPLLPDENTENRKKDSADPFCGRSKPLSGTAGWYQCKGNPRQGDAGASLCYRDPSF